MLSVAQPRHDVRCDKKRADRHSKHFRIGLHVVETRRRLSCLKTCDNRFSHPALKPSSAYLAQRVGDLLLAHVVLFAESHEPHHYACGGFRLFYIRVEHRFGRLSRR